MNPQPVNDANDAERRDMLTPRLRAMEKVIAAVAEEFSFAPATIERLRQAMAIVNGAWLLTKARHRREHHKTRALLNLLTNSQIEKWIAASSDAELRAFFKVVWRDEPMMRELKPLSRLSASAEPVGKAPDQNLNAKDKPNAGA
jgi:hypothetical protein